MDTDEIEIEITASTSNISTKKRKQKNMAAFLVVRVVFSVKRYQMRTKNLLKVKERRKKKELVQEF